MRAALRPGGWFAFSTEKLGDASGGGEYALQPSNRYAHALGYLEGLAAQNGFVVLESLEEAVRSENGRGVIGHLLVLRAAGALA
ncbi:hypothetical protein [Massilia sp. Se16.2.3]|uniref:hypothetical protein n=1 Tax=Massilia sp. Se16.2.3 TaxID=2709303 RepID=UPI001E29A3D6|nr:hypothetical protein [Massilia sp. Se16.2.3]